MLSNGSWLFDEERKEKVKKLEPLLDCIQIRTHQKYYPNYKRTWDAKKEFEAFSSKLQIFDDGIKLFPLGRAQIKHKGVVEHKMPMCGNFYLIAKQNAVASFKDLVKYIELQGKFCKPFVSSQGVIHGGETPFCTSFGTVKDSDDTLFHAVKYIKKPADVCGLAQNMPPEAKRIIGI